MSIHGSCNSGAEVTFILWEKTRKSKISNLGSVVFIEKHIAGFNISVDNSRLGFLMKVGQTLCYSKDDVVPYLPGKQLSVCSVCSKKVIINK